MARALRFVLGLLVVAVIVGLPAGYASYRNAHFRNFHVVKPGVLYRSGQMSLAGLERVVHDHGIRTVVTLRRGQGRSAPGPWRPARPNRCRSVRRAAARARASPAARR